MCVKGISLEEFPGWGACEFASSTRGCATSGLSARARPTAEEGCVLMRESGTAVLSGG